MMIRLMCLLFKVNFDKLKEGVEWLTKLNLWRIHFPQRKLSTPHSSPLTTQNLEDGGRENLKDSIFSLGGYSLNVVEI
jgi:hypothetical protein